MGDPYEDTDGQSGRPFANSTLCGTHCFPYLSDVEMLENHDYSIYHGLQVTLKQRGFKGLDFVAGYTWAHAIDLYGSNRSYDWEDPNNPLLERGDASSDVRHRFTLAMTYTMPKVEHFNSVLGGWIFNTILNFQTGEPRDLFDGDSAFSGAYTGNDRWNMYGSGNNLKWGLNGIPFIPKYDDDGNVTPQWTKTCAPYAPGLLPGIDPGTDYPTTSDYAGGCFRTERNCIGSGTMGNVREYAARFCARSGIQQRRYVPCENVRHQRAAEGTVPSGGLQYSQSSELRRPERESGERGECNDSSVHA